MFKNQLIRTMALAGLAVIIIAVAGVFLLKSSPPEKIIWDLSKGYTFLSKGYSIDAVNWPKDISGPGYERSGLFDLTIFGGFAPEITGYQMQSHEPIPSTKNGVIFHNDEVWHFYVQKERDNISWAVVHFGRYWTPDQAYTCAKKIMTDWQFKPVNFEDLEKWHDAVKMRVSQPIFIRKYENDRDFTHSLSYPNFEGLSSNVVDEHIAQAATFWMPSS